MSERKPWRKCGFPCTAARSFALTVLASTLGMALVLTLPAADSFHAAKGAGQLVVPGAPSRPFEAADADLADLPDGSQAVRLTWERAYALALRVSRGGEPAQARVLAELIAPEELFAQIQRLEPGEFDRFRSEFFAAGGAKDQPGNKFSDPADGMFEVLRRAQTAENTRREVAALERVLRMIRERIESESSGLTQLDLDRVDAAIQRARQGLIGEIRQYRDRLDELKVELGLAPGALVVPDRGNLARFRDGFAGIERWFSEPQRDITELPRLAGRLPGLAEVVIDGRPVFATLDRTPGQLETVLAAAGRVAAENAVGAAKADPRDPAVTARALRVRRRVRSLVEMRLAYRLQLRNLVLVIRLKDHAFERIVAPSPDGPFVSRSPLLRELIDQEAEILRVQNDLVALWSTFQGERLTLYRDLGTLPCNDWKSFYEQLSAQPGENVLAPVRVPDGDPAPTPLRPAPAPAPPPPAPPAPTPPVVKVLSRD